MSKKYVGKDCTYCREAGASRSADHVVPRELFSFAHRSNKPKVPSCKRCNNEKSALEGEVLATLLAGSHAANADDYRRNYVKPRLTNNARARREMGLGEPPVIMMVNSILRPMHALRVDANAITRLVGMITMGLYRFHFNRPLSRNFEPQAGLLNPVHQGLVDPTILELFPPGSSAVSESWGDGEFGYNGLRSLHHADLTVWRMRLHRVPLYGADAPPQGADTWQVTTFPTDDVLKNAIEISDL